MDNWNNEEIIFLKENYGNMDWDILEKFLGVKKSKIQKMAAKIGLKREIFFWDKKEIEILKKMYPKDSKNDICEVFKNRTWKAICKAARENGIKREIKYQWTEERIEILKNIYSDYSWNEIFEKLETNNKGTIQNMSRKLKLKRPRKFMEEEDRYIIENHYNKTIDEIGKILGRTGSSIQKRVSKLKLNKSPEWASKDKSILLSMLKDLSKKLGRTPGGREITLYNLPSPITYTRYFGSYAKACDMVGIKTDSMYGNRCFSKNGDVCLSNNESIITNYFIDNEIKYEKDQLYSRYILFVKTRKSVDWVLLDGSFVEYFGLPNKEHYRKKMEEKIILCRENNIKLIEIFDKDINELDSIFSEYKAKK